MIISAHQPAYLPWLGFFHKIILSDIFVILDDVQFEKNSFTNRNKIKTPQGDIWLTVPVQMAGHIQKSIFEMEIDNGIYWRNKHWKSIYLNYKKTQYFSKYADFFEDLYTKDWIQLNDLLLYTLKFFINELRIATKIIRQCEIGIKNKKQELILDICKKYSGDIFIFGKQGKDYADNYLFNENGINIYFQDYKCHCYEQLWGEFIPNLSILDLLFNVGRERTLEIIMKNNISKLDLKKLFDSNKLIV